MDTIIETAADQLPMQRRLRICVHVLESSRVEGGYVPSLFVEGRAGHRQITDTVWGPTLEDARREADAFNHRLNLSDADVNEIVVSALGGTQ